MKLLAVIPTYNEAGGIQTLLEQLLALPFDLSILVVDDDSPDGTAERVREMYERFPDRVELLVRRGAPRGLGNAYRDGFAVVCGRDGFGAILQMDADGQHPVEVVPKLVAALEDQSAGLVIASRYVAGGGTGLWKARRRFLSRLGGWAARRFLRLPVFDVTGGFKLWRRELLKDVMESAGESRGYSFQIETTLRAHRRGAKIIELPYTFGARRADASKMSLGIALEGARKILKWTFFPPG